MCSDIIWTFPRGFTVVDSIWFRRLWSDRSVSVLFGDGVDILERSGFHAVEFNVCPLPWRHNPKSLRLGKVLRAISTWISGDLSRTVVHIETFDILSILVSFWGSVAARSLVKDFKTTLKAIYVPCESTAHTLPCKTLLTKKTFVLIWVKYSKLCARIMIPLILNTNVLLRSRS